VKEKQTPGWQFITLSRLLAYPDQKPAASDLEWLGEEEARAWESFLEREGLAALQAEYIRLFVNALPEVSCPPYGSYYLEGVLRGASTVRIEHLYQSYGFYTDEVADHVAVELEFLSILAALPQNEEVGKDYDFLLAHLNSWVFDFFKQVEDNDSLGFYEATVKWARRVL
jgi:TorA maturation chaperone TorD